MKIAETIGNTELWKRQKTLFLCSKHAPLACHERVFQWVESFDKSGCAVCFNTSELEEEMLKALLVWRVPTVLVVTKRFRDNYNVQIEQALKENRLLIVVLQREESDGKGYIARLRNQYVIGQVQHIVCGYINPNGSIFGLLAGHDNVKYLVDRKAMKAAEEASKPYRWTVAEDKRLLRMFYEDMGIHAIHNAINRPYSTIYNRIKALTISDEALKGREFEDYVVAFFDLPHNEKLTLKEWRGDKILPGVYPENNSAPDLIFLYDEQPFAVECKWRSHMPREIEKELLPPDRQRFFLQYAKAHSLHVYLLVGIGGLPSDPDKLYFAPVSESLSITTFQQNDISTSTDILQRIRPAEPKQKRIPQYILELRGLYPNAYKPWSEDDDKLLAKMYKEGKTVKELSTLFQRNPGGIRSRLRKLGVD
ncbi:MAG: hypothetical protein IJR04_07650 [Bacteroidales bacterium]|nr:hypothetical protein [Bacteroidales bacterium]